MPGIVVGHWAIHPNSSLAVWKMKGESLQIIVERKDKFSFLPGGLEESNHRCDGMVSFWLLLQLNQELLCFGFFSLSISVLLVLSSSFPSPLSVLLQDAISHCPVCSCVMVGRNTPPLNLGFFGPAFIYYHFLDLHRGNEDHVLTRCSKAFKGWSNMFWLSPWEVESQKWTFATTTTRTAAVWGPRSSSLGRDLGKAVGEHFWKL